MVKTDRRQSVRWGGSGPAVEGARHGHEDGIRDGAVEACRALAEGGEAVQLVQFAEGDDVLYFWFPNGQGQSGIFRKATPRMLGMGTGRNWNTVLKLGEMAGIE